MNIHYLYGTNDNAKKPVGRPPSRRISRRPPAGKKCGLAAGKISASRQLGRKKCGLAAEKNAASRQQERQNAAKCQAKGGVTTRCQKIRNYRSEFIRSRR